MNKLSVEEAQNVIKKGEYETVFALNSNTIINEDVIIHDISNPKVLEVNISDNAKFLFYQVRELENDCDISFTLGENSDLEYRLLVLNQNKHKITVNVVMPNDGAKANIIVRALNTKENSNLDIVVNGKILSDTKDNELVEDLKGLIIDDNETIKISPNMMAHTNEVLANHFVTIGTFNKEELFYLMSKGLSEESAKTLLKNAFLTNILSDYLVKKMEVKEDE